MNKIMKASTGKICPHGQSKAQNWKISVKLVKLAKLLNLKDKNQTILEGTIHAYIYNKTECKAQTTYRRPVTLHSLTSYLIMV